MARIAATEETEGIRDEEDVGSAEEQVTHTPTSGDDVSMQDPSSTPQDSQPAESPQPESHSPKSKGKYVATPQEVHDSFDAVNTLRYSQPAHLSGKDEALPATLQQS
jgi:cleavage and polyadenylation specificity factor subunit 2